jgi:hypothetical protein
MLRKIKNFHNTRLPLMRANTSSRPVDPNGILARIVRFVAGLAVLAGFLSGAHAGPEIPDLSAAQLEKRLSQRDGKLQQFIRVIEKSLITGDINAAEALVDRESLLGRATARLGIADEDALRNVFADSTQRAWDQRGVLRDYAKSRFRFLRTRTLGGRSGLLFRSSTRANGMNYALLTINETKPGGFRISDVFVVGLNEYLSSTLRRTYRNVAAGFLAGEDDAAVPGVNGAYVKNIAQIAAMSRELQAGHYEKVLLTLKDLPVAVQSERGLLLMRMEAAEHVSVDERDSAYAAWLAVYPDEMELPLKFADFYVTHRQWDNAERVLRGLLTKLGPDAMLKNELGTVMFRREHDYFWSGPVPSLSAR